MRVSLPLLSDAQRLALLRADLGAFIRAGVGILNPGSPYQHNWHIDLIADRLMRVQRGEIKRLIINLPPRNLKSICTSVAFPAWLLGLDPGKKIICASYSSELADKLARDTHAVMMSPLYRQTFPATQLSSTRRAMHDFTTTVHGVRYAVSTGGSLTGRGADILIIDDPAKPDEVMSDVQRQAVNDWYDSTALTRLDDKQHGAIVIIMQRLHLDDLVGHVLAKGEQWEVVNLPAIAEEETTWIYQVLGQSRTVIRQVGSVLHEAREPLATLQSLRLSMGEFAFAGQYQQSPVPVGGGLIKTDWLKYYIVSDLPEKFDLVVQSWDTASKAHQFADCSVCVTIGIKNQIAYVIDVYRARLEFPALKQAAIRLRERYKPNAILVEDKSSGTQLIQEMKEVGMYQVIAIKPNGDKQTRLFRQAVKFENGRVLLPQQAPWLNDFVLELTAFPAAKFDDQVDAMTQALDYLQDRMEEPPFFGYMRMESERMGLPWPPKSPR